MLCCERELLYVLYRYGTVTYCYTLHNLCLVFFLENWKTQKYLVELLGLQHTLFL